MMPVAGDQCRRGMTQALDRHSILKVVNPRVRTVTVRQILQLSKYTLMDRVLETSAASYK